MQLFGGGDEFLTKNSLASIMGKVPVTVDLSAKAAWRNDTFAILADGNTLQILKNWENRLLAFPVALPSCQEINVKIDLVSKGKWEYFFTKSPRDLISGDCFGDPGWRTTATENIKVPNGAKYMGIDLALTDNTNISQVSDVATTMQFLAKTTLGSFFLADSGEIMQFN